MKNWVQVSKLRDIPKHQRIIEPSTAYKWHHIRRYPDLFKHVGGKLFLDLDLLYQKAEAGHLR